MKEKLSALVDGQLEEQGASELFAAVLDDPGLQQDWNCYCLVGDMLRGEGVAVDLTARVMQRLDQEPALAVAPLPVVARPAANDPWFARVLPLAASLAGVAAVVWVALSMQSPAQVPLDPMTTARVPLPTAATVAQAATTEEQRHREFVVAHQGMAGGGPIPGVVQYVRTVSDIKGGAGQ